MVQTLVSKLWRWIGAAYAIIFLAATSAASHRHLNGIEDLLSDGRSDSGLIVAGSVFQDDGGPVVGPVRILDDDPCLACFAHDFVASASCVFALCSPSVSLARIEVAPRPALPPPGDRPTASRSPPVAS